MDDMDAVMENRQFLEGRTFYAILFLTILLLLMQVEKLNIGRYNRSFNVSTAVYILSLPLTWSGSTLPQITLFKTRKTSS